MPNPRRGVVAVLRPFALLALSMILLGCPAGDVSDPEPDTAVADVTLTAPSTTIDAGASVQLSASATNADGVDLGALGYVWSSSNEAVATVSGTGMVTTHAVGTAQITATESTSGVEGNITLTVVPAPVHTVTLTPPNATLTAGETEQLAVVLRDVRGAILDDRAIAWTSSNEDVASVDGSGLVSAHVAGGPVMIVASSEGKSDTTQVTVNPVPVASVVVTPPVSNLIEGDTWLLTATVTAAGGDTLTDRTVVWASSDTMVASVDQTGLVTAKVAGGPVTISATADGVAGTAQVTVAPMPIATVEVTPASATLILGDSLELTVVARAANGDTLTGRAVVWTTADSAVATVSAAGLVRSTGVGGPIAIVATAEGRADTALVTVNPVPVATVVVTPASATLEQGESQQLVATTQAANGDTLTGRALVWSSADSSIATVDANGVVSAVGVGGPVQITATSEGMSGAAQIEVIPVPVADVLVDPAAVSLEQGLTAQLSATPVAANGDTLAGRAVSWASADTTLVRVDANGLVTAVAVGGPVVVSATIEGVSATVDVTVTAIPVGSVQLSVAMADLFPDDTLTLGAVALAADGDTLSDRQITWTSRAPGIASVDANGFVSALSIGEAWIVAESEGVSDSARVTVWPHPVATVIVEPASAALLELDTLRLDAVTLAPNGDTLTDRPVSWNSRDAAIASVDGAGLVTAHTAGSVWIVASSEGVADSTQVTVSPRPVASVLVEPAAASVVDGDTLRLGAATLAANGDTLTGRAVAWSSSDTSIATVDASGLVSALGVGGPVTITATSEGIDGSAQITVTSAPLGSIDVGPDSAALFVGDTVRFAAVAFTTTGDTLAGQAFVWESRDASVASVDSTGLVSGLVAGEVWVVASAGSAADSALVVVSDVPVASIAFAPASPATVVGDTVRIEAFALSAAGDTLNDRTVAFSSADSAVALVDSTGLVAGIAVGSAWIRASAEGVTDSVQVTVAAAPAASLVVAPDSAGIWIGDSLALGATVTDTNGQPMTVAVDWSSLDGAIATVDSLGVVTGVGIGGARIVASFEGHADTAHIDVATPISAIVITPDSATLTAIGATQPYSAVAYDTAGAPMAGIVFDWTSLNPTVVTVDPASGETTTATAVAAGETQVRASALGVSALAAVRVGQFASTIDVSPDSLTLTVNGYATLSADARDGSDAPIDDADIRWRASNANVVVDSLSGVVRGAVLGTAYVWAELDGVTSDSVAITVSNVAPPSLSFGTPLFQVGRNASVSVPIYLSTAPSSDVVVLLTTADTMYAEFQPARLVVSAGQTVQNASLYGYTIGELNIHATDSAGTYGADTARVRVQTVASLTVPGIAYYQTYTPAMHVGETYTAELRLSDPAPAGGMYFTIGRSRVDVDETTVYVPAGQMLTTIDFFGVEAGSGVLSANASGTTTASFNVQVMPAALFVSQGSGAPGAYTIGLGQRAETANTPMVTTAIKLREELSVDLLWSDASLVDAPTGVTLTRQGFNDSAPNVQYIEFDALALGTTTLTASAAGWTPAVRDVIVTSPMFVMNAGSGSRDSTSVTTTSGQQVLYATASDSASIGHPVIADTEFQVWAGDTTIVRLEAGTHTMPAGQQSYQNIRFDPIGAGVTWIYTGGPGFMTDSIMVRVNAPQIVLNGGSPTMVVPTGYVSRSVGVTIPPTPTPPAAMFFESSDTMVAAIDSMVAPNPSYSTNYLATIRSRVAGEATVIVSAPGYAPDTILVRSIEGQILASAQPIVMFQTGSLNISMYDSVGHPIAALDSTTVNVTVLDPAIVAMDSTVGRVGPGGNPGWALPFQPLAPGVARFLVEAPNMPAETASVTVSAAQLTFASYRNELPTWQSSHADVATGLRVVLPAVRDTDVVVRFTHADATLLALAADSVVIPAGQTQGTVHWETFGMLGTDTVVATADGYTTASQAASVREPRILPGSLPPGDHRTTMAPVEVTFGLGMVGDVNIVGVPSVPVTIYVQSTDSSVFVPDSAAIHFQPGDNYRRVPVRFVGPGSARLVYTDSAGVYAPDSSNVTNVVAPPIQIASGFFGYNGYVGELTLGMGQISSTTNNSANAVIRLADPVTGEPLVIHLTSSDTTVATVPDSLVIPVGESSIELVVTAGDTVGAIAIFATAEGLQQGRMNVDVVQPALRLAVNTGWTMPTDTAYRGQLSIYGGNTGDFADHPPAEDLTLQVTSSNPSVIAIEPGTVVMPAGSEAIHVQVMRFVGPGTTTITVSDPRTGFVVYQSDSEVVTVNP